MVKPEDLVGPDDLLVLNVHFPNPDARNILGQAQPFFAFLQLLLGLFAPRNAPV
jgi:hypothetical protein